MRGKSDKRGGGGKRGPGTLKEGLGLFQKKKKK